MKSKHVVDLLGAVAPAAGPAAQAMTKQKSSADMGKALTHSLLPGLAVGAAGAYFWRKHRVLGFLGGSALGAVAYPLYKGEDRAKAGLCLGAVGAGVFASLKWKKHPALGYVGAAAAVGLAAPVAVSKLKGE